MITKSKINKQNQGCEMILPARQQFAHPLSQRNFIEQNSARLRKINRLKILRNYNRSNNFKLKESAFFSIQNQELCQNRYRLSSDTNECAGYSARYASTSIQRCGIISSARDLPQPIFSQDLRYKSIESDAQNINDNIVNAQQKNKKFKTLRVKTECCGVKAREETENMNIIYKNKGRKNVKEIKYKSLEIKKQTNLINRSTTICSTRLQNTNAITKNKDKFLGIKKTNKNRRRFLTQIANKQKNQQSETMQRKERYQMWIKKSNNCTQNQLSSTIEQISSIISHMNQQDILCREKDENHRNIIHSQEQDLSILKNIDDLDTLLNNYVETIREQPDKFKRFPQSLICSNDGDGQHEKEEMLIISNKLKQTGQNQSDKFKRVETKKRQKVKGLISRSIDKIKYKFPKDFFCTQTNNQYEYLK